MSIYDHPTLYDVLFSDGCKREVDFLTAAVRLYLGMETASIFEPACGTGRLLWRLAKAGHEIAGLDLNPKAVAFCNRRLKRHGFSGAARIGDMTCFSLAELGCETSFDLAFNLVSSFLHLTTENTAAAHLHAMAESLKLGGIYLLGLHLLPRGEAACSSECWQARHGSLALTSCLKRRDLDRRRRLETVEFRIEATTPKRTYCVVDRFPLRTYTLSQFLSLLRSIDRFDMLDVFDFSLDPTRPIRLDTKTEDAVFVLKRR